MKLKNINLVIIIIIIKKKDIKSKSQKHLKQTQHLQNVFI